MNAEVYAPISLTYIERKGYMVRHNVSAKALGRQFGVTYKTAWRLARAHPVKALTLAWVFPKLARGAGLNVGKLCGGCQ